MTTPSTHGLSPATVEAVAGLSAGLVSTVIVHPLDIIKTRLQVDTTSHPLLNSSRSVLRDIWRNEGPTRVSALYRGLTPNLVGNSAGWGLYFLWYRQAQDLIRNVRNYELGRQLTAFDYLCASSLSGILSAIFTNPIWVIKTRMLTTSATQVGAYTGMVSGLRSIYKMEGTRGLFHGLTPTLIGVSHGSLYFMAYEKLKLWRRATKKDGQLSNTDTLITSSMSKIFAGLITYPHQLVRARLQTYNPSAAVHRRGPGVINLTRMIWRNEGIVGYYKGLFPNLLRVVPSTCVTFLVYENVRWSLPGLSGADDDRPVEVTSNSTVSTKVEKKETL
ncbi:uncharacterized protein A1O9_03169 [Exophiala aquamarina CBS 119918]|uniref:Uncharacterized protein n=1 Tax=Exophiala aquamarina CBS 119918 TaxID=1182545 RepID=A0A072PNX2_9EURO|nr:uncharacterized protein A1O9_03169 [Exophiala aquamarina CBS 119918]KEF61601.1 hypothetical protein A1O9_03169 [Exophiala aquamarina CBS 119918]